MSLGLAEFTFDPELSYLERTLIRSNVTSQLTNFCLRLYRGEKLVETIDFDWAIGVRLPKRKSYVYFHYDPNLATASALESQDKQWIISFCPKNPELITGEQLRITLGFSDEFQQKLLQSDQAP